MEGYLRSRSMIRSCSSSSRRVRRPLLSISALPSAATFGTVCVSETLSRGGGDRQSHASRRAVDARRATVDEVRGESTVEDGDVNRRDGVSFK